MYAGLLVWRDTFLTGLEAGYLVHVPGVHVQHHQLVALGAEDDLLVAEPLAAEHLHSTVHRTLLDRHHGPYLAHLVHVHLQHRVLLQHGIAQHVPSGVFCGKPLCLEPPILKVSYQNEKCTTIPVTTPLPVDDAVH